MSSLHFTKWQTAWVFTLIIGLMSASCAQPSLTAIPLDTTAYHFTPYQTPTSSSTVNLPTPKTTRTTTPTSTATPFLHKIVKDDTLLGIGIRYGVTLDDLLAANPGINPQLLIIGNTVVIPIKGQALSAIPTSTPIPLTILDPACYSTTDGGAWCFALITNPYTQALENISGWIGLYSSNGENLAGQIANTPLNILPAGGTMPLTVFFPPPLPVQFTANVALLTALSIADGDPRYLTARIKNIETSISPNGKEGRINGNINISPNGPPANTVWLLVVAYDQAGQVVGIRKWEAGMQEACVGFSATATAYPTNASTPWGGLSKECLSFDITVYSLGFGITRMEVLVEARP